MTFDEWYLDSRFVGMNGYIEEAMRATWDASRENTIAELKENELDYILMHHDNYYAKLALGAEKSGYLGTDETNKTIQDILNQKQGDNV